MTTNWNTNLKPRDVSSNSGNSSSSSSSEWNRATGDEKYLNYNYSSANSISSSSTNSGSSGRNYLHHRSNIDNSGTQSNNPVTYPYFTTSNRTNPTVSNINLTSPNSSESNRLRSPYSTSSSSTAASAPHTPIKGLTSYPNSSFTSGPYSQPTTPSSASSNSAVTRYSYKKDHSNDYQFTPSSQSATETRYPTITPSTSFHNKMSSSGAPQLRNRNTSANDATNARTNVRETLRAKRLEMKQARQGISLFRAPFVTLAEFSKICLEYFVQLLEFLLSHTSLLFSSIAVLTIFTILYLIPGHHTPLMSMLASSLVFAGWWVTLGVLSSVGLGTGLHTFVLYLGPYIAKVTLAVTECGTLNVPTEGPNAFVCPSSVHPSDSLPSFLAILVKVMPAAFLWGLGTAIGELPPYFVSRAAKLSGQKLAELDELDELDHENNNNNNNNRNSKPTNSHGHGHHHPHHEGTLSAIADRFKLIIYHCLQRYGFWAILIFASIPNPLFDLAGLTCGHFLIPFWTFFGATLVGKAIIKSQLQSGVIVLAFSKDRIVGLVNIIESLIPSLEGVLGPFFEKQRTQFHLNSTSVDDDVASSDGSIVSFLWNLFLAVMILGFVRSIIDSNVQERLATRDALKLKQMAMDNKMPVDVAGDEDDE